MSIILLISSFSSVLKTTTSSIRFKNSGANAFLSAFSITPFAWSEACASLAEVPKPTP